MFMSSLLKISDSSALFKKANQIMQKSGYHYWICDGTLLGIIRDNKLLEWDHDIDFAVWKSEVDVDVLRNLFISSGFIEESLVGQDCLHFIGGNKKVDISLFSQDSKSFFCNFLYPPKFTFLSKILYHICDILCSKTTFGDLFLNFKNSKMRVVVFLFKLFMLIIRPLISDKSKNKLLDYSLKKFVYVSAGYPLHLKKFRNISFLDETFLVPFDCEEYLCIAYGKDWKTPKKDYNWYTDEANLNIVS